MADWLVEDGIAEQRAIRLRNGEIAEARMLWPGECAAGAVVDAILVSRMRGARRGTARLPDGTETLVDGLPPQASEGAAIRLRITRPPLAERGRLKRAHARPADEPLRPSPSLMDQLRDEGHQPRVVHRFPDGDWDGLVAEALHGEVPFAGGSLLISPTPAMTLIDIDGPAGPRELALAAAPVIGAAIRRLDLAGSIGIDFPTLAEKQDRRAVDACLDDALAGWPHERTAMNGFGFVQMVARVSRPSLIHRAAFQRAGMAARLVLRRAERLDGPGILELSGHPSVGAAIVPEWMEELRRRAGRPVRWRSDSGLAIDAPHAQLVEP